MQQAPGQANRRGAPAPLAQLAGPLLLSLVLGLGWGCSPGAAKPPMAEGGELDLRAWSWDRSERIALHGEWAFYWGRLVPPDSLTAEHSAPGRLLLHEPGFWSDARGEGPSPPKTGGCATYHLRILMPRADASPVAIYLTQIASAFQVWVNGSLVAQSGEVGCRPGDELPRPRPVTVQLPRDTSRVDLVVHLSDHEGWPSGHLYDASIGTSSAIRAKWRAELRSGLLIVGALVIMALYHFALYTLNPRDRSLLYFSLLIVSFILYYGFGVGTEVRWILFGPDQQLALRYGAGTVILFPLFLIAFMRGLFPEELPRWLLLASAVLFPLLWAVWMLLPGAPGLWAFIVFRFSALAFVAWAAGGLLLAVKRSRPGAFAFAVGLLILLGTVVNDVLSNQGIVDGSNLSHWGILAFLFSQAWVLAIRSATAFRTVRAQREELRRFRDHLQELVDARTRELEAALEELDKTRAAEAEALRLRTVSQLAGTIAHEFNNPLAVVNSAMELARMRLARGEDPGFDGLQARVTAQVERMEELVQKLLSLRDLKEIDYVAGTKILDLHRSAPGAERHPGGEPSRGSEG